MANDAVQIRLVLENEALTKQLRDTERKFARLEGKAKKSADTINQVFIGAFKGIAAAFLTIELPQQIISSIIDTSKAVADLADQADALGVSFKSFQVLQFAASQAGTDIETVTKALAKMEVALGKANEEAFGAENAFSKIGVSIEKLNQLSPEEQFVEVAKALAAIENPATRAARASEIFGKSFVKLVPLLESAAGGLNSWTKEAEDAGVIIDDLTRQKLAKLDDAVERSKLSWLKFKAEAITPVAVYMDEVLALAFDKNISKFEKLGRLINSFSIPGQLRSLLFPGDTSVEAPSVGNTDFAERVAAQRQAADDAYSKEQEAFNEHQRKLKAIEDKRFENATEQSTKVIDASRKAGEQAALAYAEGLASAQKAVDDAKAAIQGFDESGEAGLAEAKRKSELASKIASATKGVADPEKAKALADLITQESEYNKILDERIEGYSRAQEIADEFYREQEQNSAQWASDMERDAQMTYDMWANIGTIVGDSLASIVTGTQTAKEALLDLLKTLLIAIAQAAILAAFGQGSFGSNLGAFFGGPSSRSGTGPNIRVYNFGSAPGGIQTQVSPQGDIDIIIGQVASAIGRGGNSIDSALRRSYGIGRVGR